ncbi:MAG: hypothetical protein RSC49_08225 [Clostridium sp.]
MKTAEQVQDLITPSDSPWCEFENNFEEAWDANPKMVSIANLKRHRDVANRVANILSIIYDGELELCNEYGPFKVEDIISDIYRRVAGALYPEDKIWTGDKSDTPEFWTEYFKENNTCPEERKSLWSKEWGPIPLE